MGSMIDTRGQTSVDSESIVYSLGKEQPFIQLTGMGSSVFETDWNYPKSATAYILSFPYSTDISYKERLRLTELIPLCYWQEYLDLVYTYKSIVNNTDTQFKISKSVRITRGIASTKSILLDIRKAKTVTFHNSFYSRASRTFNTLPEYLRDNTWSINVFKTNLRKRYLDLTLTVYDPAVPQNGRPLVFTPNCKLNRKAML